MARPFLADPHFVNKAQSGQVREINTCIACNQACLDHVFIKKTASCLVNPFACHETILKSKPAQNIKKIAIVGAGPAGCMCAIELARRGHQVTLYEASNQLGGQFNLSAKIPGKEEFKETLEYFSYQLNKLSVNVLLQKPATAALLLDHDYDEIVIAAGVAPRIPDIEGIDHPMVVDYMQLIQGRVIPGKRVAIIGAGGIGFDAAVFLAFSGKPIAQDLSAYYREWGIDIDMTQRGGLMQAHVEPSACEIYLLQRKKQKHGATLGKTTGWIHRLTLRDKKVKMLAGVSYNKIDDQGLHIAYEGEALCLAVDQVVICAGQTSLKQLYQQLEAKHPAVHIIGGAHVAREVDAKKAIHEAVCLALKI